MSDSLFPTVVGAGDEVRESTAYEYRNVNRGGVHMMAIQRTLSGRGWFRDARGTHSVPAGHAMLFTHDEPTAYGYPADATEPYVLRFVTITTGVLAPLFARLRHDFGSVVSLPDAAGATALHDEICRRFAQRAFDDRLHEADLIHRLLVALWREQIHGARATDPIEFGHHYLRSHFRAPINLKLVAEKCGVSREHFIREFSRRYREPPGALLRRLRLEQARAMLATTDSDVETVALASGYASANTFCRAYRQNFGHSPRSAA